jgi:hypothetical protein
VGKTTLIKALVFGGHERTYQSWNGVDAAALESNRTFNSAGMFTDQLGNIRFYDNETDNYHIQCYLAHGIGNNIFTSYNVGIPEEGKPIPVYQLVKFDGSFRYNFKSGLFLRPHLTFNGLLNNGVNNFFNKDLKMVIIEFFKLIIFAYPLAISPYLVYHANNLVNITSSLI